jgi:hypothetical protein
MRKRIRIDEPAPHYHRKRRGQSGTERNRHLDVGQAEDEHGRQREPYLRLQERRDGDQPGLQPAVTEGARLQQQALRRHLRERGEEHQHEEGGFLDDQAGDQRQAPRVLHGEPVRRLRKAGRPRRQES